MMGATDKNKWQQWSNSSIFSPSVCSPFDVRPRSGLISLVFFKRAVLLKVTLMRTLSGTSPPATRVRAEQMLAAPVGPHILD